MADRYGPRPSELVFCHECQNEWRKNEHGLTCPECHSDFTEIIEQDNDPRMAHVEDVLYPESPSTYNPHRPTNPAPAPAPTESDVSRMGRGVFASQFPDPVEGDIDEVIQGSGPDGSLRFTRITYRSNSPRAHGPSPLDPASMPVFEDFQRMVHGLLGPQAEIQTHTQQRPRVLPPMGPFGIPGRAVGVFGSGGQPGVGIGPARIGGTFTYSTGSRLTPRDATTAQPVADPVDGLPASILQLLFSGVADGSPRGPGMTDPHTPANPLATLFSTLLNPAAASDGDAVYTQEALDRVISQLMEQNAGSNAPGPASAAAIASLPKKKIEMKMLDEQGKVDCSICMDEVPVGDEVTELPCHHWFHTQCATAWLTEHDTCPICRKGITPKEGDLDRPRTPNQDARHPEPWRQAPTPGLFGTNWPATGGEAASARPTREGPGAGTGRSSGPSPRSGPGPSRSSASHRPQGAGDDGEGSNDSGGISGRLRGWFGGN
ncbi:MAG: hypothetical protein M1838_005270 [Thelocarpon superellum]|nr:MAG: hypothetical protein M1838_005270 [Thelocarpon superellum]